MIHALYLHFYKETVFLYRVVYKYKKRLNFFIFHFFTLYFLLRFRILHITIIYFLWRNSFTEQGHIQDFCQVGAQIICWAASGKFQFFSSLDKEYEIDEKKYQIFLCLSVVISDSKFIWIFKIGQPQPEIQPNAIWKLLGRYGVKFTMNEYYENLTNQYFHKPKCRSYLLYF